MSAKELLDLIRGWSLPLFELVCSVVAGFTVWAIAVDSPVTDALKTFASALGLPAGVSVTIAQIHDWIAADSRTVWIPWVAAILAAAAGSRYVRAIYKLRDAVYEVGSAGSEVRFSRSVALKRNWRESEESMAQRITHAEAEFDKAFDYFDALEKQEGGSQLRCACIFWLAAAIAVEVRAAAVQNLIAVGGLILLSMLIASGMKSYYRPEFPDPLLRQRLMNQSLAFGSQCYLLVQFLLVALLFLPLYLGGKLFYSENRARIDSETKRT